MNDPRERIFEFCAASARILTPMCALAQFGHAEPEVFVFFGNIEDRLHDGTFALCSESGENDGLNFLKTN